MLVEKPGRAVAVVVEVVVVEAVVSAGWSDDAPFKSMAETVETDDESREPPLVCV